jgi:hypothetical protein
MASLRWLIQVYEMSDVAAQESALSKLSGMPGLTVDARFCERGNFLIVECTDDSQAMKVYELVVMADPNAELIQSATTPSGVEAVMNHRVELPLVPSEPRVQMGRDAEA